MKTNHRITSLEERQRIEKLVNEHYSVAAISRLTGLSVWQIRYEIERADDYQALPAHRSYRKSVFTTEKTADEIFGAWVTQTERLITLKTDLEEARLRAQGMAAKPLRPHVRSTPDPSQIENAVIQIDSLKHKIQKEEAKLQKMTEEIIQTLDKLAAEEQKALEAHYRFEEMPSQDDEDVFVPDPVPMKVDADLLKKAKEAFEKAFE